MKEKWDEAEENEQKAQKLAKKRMWQNVIWIYIYNSHEKFYISRQSVFTISNE